MLTAEAQNKVPKGKMQKGPVEICHQISADSTFLIPESGSEIFQKNPITVRDGRTTLENARAKAREGMRRLSEKSTSVNLANPVRSAARNVNPALTGFLAIS